MLLLRRNDSWAYLLMAVLYCGVLFLRNREVRYADPPVASAGFERSIGRTLRTSQFLNESMQQLQAALTEVTSPMERLHLQHNIGITYYDLYSLSNRRELLDSAATYFIRSIRDNPPVARFYYNFGRIQTAVGNHSAARELYERALQVDTAHVLARHNLGLLYYYELHQPQKARYHLQKLAEQEDAVPVCHYVLGEIALELGEPRKALVHFEKEVDLFSRLQSQEFSLPMGRKTIQYAAATSLLRLSVLYRAVKKDTHKADQYFSQYLALETDQQRKAGMQKKFGK